MKTTKSEIENLFNTFCSVYNLRTRKDITTRQDIPSQETFYSEEFVRLDYNSVYGGYRIDIVETGTGERFFDGSPRMKASEMKCYLYGLLAARHSYRFDGIVKPVKVA